MKGLLLACVVMFSTTAAYADPLTVLIGNKAQWETMDWKGAERSAIWNIKDWAPFEGKQEEGRIFEKVRSVDINGKQMSAYIINKKIPYQRYALSISSTGLRLEECVQIEGWLASKFSKPNRVVDASYKSDLMVQGNTIEFIDRASQWDIGKTRSTFTCAGVKTAAAEKRGDADEIIGVLVFSEVEGERQIKPLFGLHCTQRIEYIGAVLPPKNISDMVLVVNENRGKISSANKVPLPGEHVITNDSLEFQIKKEDFTIKYFIDRYSGELRASLKFHDGSGGANVFGHCDKIEPGARRF